MSRHAAQRELHTAKTTQLTLDVASFLRCFCGAEGVAAKFQRELFLRGDGFFFDNGHCVAEAIHDAFAR